MTTAAAYGWHVYMPMELSFLWDGEAVFWTYGDVGEWLPLEAAQFPHFSDHFDTMAPPEIRGWSPPFLTALPEPGLVQIWTGLMARTAPDWSLLVRAPANLPCASGVTLFEGMLETDRWFGPLFINLRLTRTHMPIYLGMDLPLAQIQPLPRPAYSDHALESMHVIDELQAADWEDYREAIVRPGTDPNRQQGQYAISARKRRKAECPFKMGSRAADASAAEAG